MSLADVPGFALINECDAAQIKKARNAAIAIVGFTLAPQLFAGLIYFVSSVQWQGNVLVFIYQHFLQTAQLLFYSVALLGPVYLAISQDGIRDRGWVQFYVTVILVAAALMIALVDVDYPIDAVRSGVIAVVLFVATSLLVFLANLLKGFDPEDIARRVDKLTAGSVDKLSTQVRREREQQ